MWNVKLDEYQNDLNIKLFDIVHSNVKCQNIRHWNDKLKNGVNLKLFDGRHSKCRKAFAKYSFVIF